ACVPRVDPPATASTCIRLPSLPTASPIIAVTVLLPTAHDADIHIVAPRILGAHPRLHPAMVIFALLAGNALMGILGVLLAAPLAALLNITLTYLITEGALSPAAVVQGDDIPLPPAVPGPPEQGETAGPRAQGTG